jgi:excisionase family DNA binding protein
LTGKEKTVMALTSASDAEQLDELQLYRVKDAMQLLNLSRTVIYELLRTGRLRSVQQGRARLITADAIRDYIRLLRDEAEQPTR